ncbi:MAG: pilin [Candidatus Veblenbacteria bacterium]|nr:pilin [Candidatus Veblenbacteria bacterium]
MILPNRTLRFTFISVLYLAVSVALSGGLTLTASAQTPPTPAIPPDYGLTQTAQQAGLPTGDVSPVELAATAINMVLGFIGVILVILVIYAGFMWMTAAGEEEKIRKAKSLLGNAVVGLAIVLAAYAIAYFTVKSIAQSTGMTWQDTGSTDCGPIISCGPGAPPPICRNGVWDCGVGD